MFKFVPIIIKNIFYSYLNLIIISNIRTKKNLLCITCFFLNTISRFYATNIILTHNILVKFNSDQHYIINIYRPNSHMKPIAVVEIL